MILVTGGLGFIGWHTTRALLDLGEDCVIVQRRPAVPREALDDDLAKRLVIEQADLADLDALRALGERHPITGIVHLAGSVPWPPDDRPPVAPARHALDTLFNVVQAAADWQVRRLSVASTIGVYGGVVRPGALSEDVPLSMSSGHVIPAFKKIGELLTDYLAGALDLEIVNLRIGAIWGPFGRPASPFIAAPQLVHAAAHGTTPDLSTLYAPAYAGDGIDLCYVKDCARAIGLLQLAPELKHRTYNIASGRTTANAEVVAAIKALAPDARVDLPAGRNPQPQDDFYLDIGRLRDDTGYWPEYGVDRAVADYLAWLRAGNPN
jgi:UDP-glucose 4-epimerase